MPYYLQKLSPIYRGTIEYPIFEFIYTFHEPDVYQTEDEVFLQYTSWRTDSQGLYRLDISIGIKLVQNSPLNDDFLRQHGLRWVDLISEDDYNKLNIDLTTGRMRNEWLEIWNPLHFPEEQHYLDRLEELATSFDLLFSTQIAEVLAENDNPDNQPDSGEIPHLEE